MTRSTPRALAGDGGFTLVEVLVTILIGMIVLAAALATMTFGFQSSAKVQDRHDTAGRARMTLDRATTLLQAQVCNGTTSPVTEATKTKVTFTTNIGPVNPPQVYQYSLWYDAASRRLMQTKWQTMGAPDANGRQTPSGPVDTVVADEVVPDFPDGTVFRYFGTSDPVAFNEVNLADATGTIADQEQRARILSVKIALKAVPTRTKNDADRTSSSIHAQAYVTSNLDPAKMHKGPQCN